MKAQGTVRGWQGAWCGQRSLGCQNGKGGGRAEGVLTRQQGETDVGEVTVEPGPPFSPSSPAPHTHARHTCADPHSSRQEGAKVCLMSPEQLQKSFPGSTQREWLWHHTVSLAGERGQKVEVPQGGPSTQPSQGGRFLASRTCPEARPALPFRRIQLWCSWSM